MKNLSLSENLFYCGVNDEKLRIFDIIMETPYGTTYNSYILKNNDNYILFETVKDGFFDEFVEYLKKITHNNLSKITHLVVSHTEPDHAGNIKRIIKLNPNIKIVCTAIAAGYIKEIINDYSFNNYHLVKNNEVLEIGKYHLKFLTVPNLHWPDTMYTYIEEEKTLVTCDSFGSHYCFEGHLLSEVKKNDDFLDAFKYYFDAIMGPFKNPFVLNALSAIKGLDIKYIATGHGPIVDCRFEELFDLYKKWSTPIKSSKPKITVAYVSAYGYTKAMTDIIIDEIKKAKPDFEIKAYDLNYSKMKEVVASILESDGFLLGTPTILNDALEPIWMLVSHLLPPLVAGKKAAAYGSYGWSGEGVKNISERLAQLRVKTVEGLKIRFNPDSEAKKQAIKDFAKNYLTLFDK